ncbi:glycosyltransferase [Shewanella baltica]|jgi:glycosyltransferase involved in cell wall biosynthesis|uniref:glycosyltransferase n=1 Tax=Shewanella baltica TaxID=62322 RepID=UPI0039AF296A
MKKPLVFILCNAMDDELRLSRSISTDSPAASRKVFMLCQSLRLAGLRPIVLSLGRGKANGTRLFFGKVIKKVNGVPVIYAPFTHVRFLSELISLLYFILPILKLSSLTLRSIIFYNRMPAYIPSLLVGYFFGYKCLIDLEDGEVLFKEKKSLKTKITNFIPYLFDRFTNSGALLACSALSKMTNVRPVLCYYGTSADAEEPRSFDGDVLRFLVSGTLESETGIDMLLDALAIIKDNKPAWINQVIFEVTGKGTYLDLLSKLSFNSNLPRIIVHGRATDVEYRNIISHCDVGLALKPVSGELANTTFPSKVIEYASAGLLVLSTDISDVRKLFDTGAVYLESNQALELVNAIEKIYNDRVFARETALIGHNVIKSKLSSIDVGNQVKNFIFEGL